MMRSRKPLETNSRLQQRVPKLSERKYCYSPAEIQAMTRKEASTIVGGKVWDVAQVDRLVAAAIRRNKMILPVSLPRLFLSYTWENDRHREWVLRLAGDLNNRGYDLVFDKLAEVEGAAADVPALVAKMVSCNFFLPVLTSSYCSRVPHGTGRCNASWVFDEWMTALYLSGPAHDRLRMLGILRDDCDLPPPLDAESVCDFRDDRLYQQSLDIYFPKKLNTVIVMLQRQDGQQINFGPMPRFDACRMLTEEDSSTRCLAVVEISV